MSPISATIKPTQKPETITSAIPTITMIARTVIPGTADRYRALAVPSASDALLLCHFKQPEPLLLVAQGDSDDGTAGRRYRGASAVRSSSGNGPRSGHSG
jgi:hypothetical protein